MTVQSEILKTPAAKQWNAIGIKHHHGINVPLFALHSDKSCGIGEFPDLIPLIDWCAEIGYDIIQLLPLNDTGPESSPYSAISAFALNPIYLGLAELPYLNEFQELKSKLPDLQKLDKSKRIDYQRVRAGKEQFLAEYYVLAGPLIVHTADFEKFKEENPWLKPFALFKSMKILLKWAAWENWGKELYDPTIEKYYQLCDQFSEEINYHIFVQYLCFQQMIAVKDHANKKKILIKGDIPILISRESADVWLYGLLFLIYYSAGAPPDMYAVEGQNWGSPIYDWVELESQNDNWWRWRLRVAERIYHIYRIDHIVGFYRIWAIPNGEQAKEGKFIPENTKMWLPQGERIMRMMLDSCDMLPIGEDLGTVPDEVRQSLRMLGISGTKMMRWERNWKGKKEFIDPKEYDPISMTTVSTHDSETLTMWWSESPDEAKDYCAQKGWVYKAPLSKDKLFRMLRDSHQSSSLFHINLLQEYLALIPGMTWDSPSDERINVPGIVNDANWTYRFRPSVEEIVSNSELKHLMKDLIK